MYKTVGKVVLWLVGIITVLLLSAVLLAYLLEDKITQRITAGINQQLSVPVQVKGGIDLSLIRHFPYASLTFKNVEVADKLQKGKKLLNVQEFSLLCNLMSLFGDKVELSKIYIKNGEINFYKDDKGVFNYEIFKPNKDTTKAKFDVRLKKAEVKNVKFTYTDKPGAFKSDADIASLNMKGNFSDKQFDVSAEANAIINSVFSSGQEFVERRKVKAEVVMRVDNEKHLFTFKKGKIDLDDNEFSITGFFASIANGIQLDFKLLHEGKDLQKFFALMPQHYRASFANASGSGQYTINADVKGLISATTFPKVNVNATLKDSELKLSKYNKLLKEVNASAHYELDEKGNDKIVISNFNCTLNNLPFNFKLALTKLTEPDFDFYANGTLHVSEISAFIPDSVVRDADGTITFNNFHIKGSVKDFSDVTSSTLTGSGQFKLSEVEFQQNGISYGNINGELTYNNQVVEARNFTLNFLGNQAAFSGDIRNLLAFAYNLGLHRNAGNVVLGINGQLAVKTLNLSGTIDAYSKKNKPAGAPGRGKIDVREILNMEGNLDVAIGKFIYRKLEFDNVHGNLQIAPGVIQTNNLRVQAMDGDLALNGKIAFGDDYSMAMAYDLKAVNLSIPKFFSECENFGQNTLTDHHLKGTLNTAISFNCRWLNYKDLDQNSLSAIVDFDIKNGQLIKFEPLKAASKFIRVDELENIQFSDIANTIKIANKRIDIPEFEIKSTALNLMFDGYHYFNNTVDYHFKINLHKLLAQKFSRKHENDIEYMETDPYEGVNLYLSMTGDLSNPKIKYDKAKSRKKMIADFKSEKQNLKNLINNKVPEINGEEKKKEEHYYQIQQTPQFMDFDSTDK